MHSLLGKIECVNRIIIVEYDKGQAGYHERAQGGMSCWGWGYTIMKGFTVEKTFE